MEDSKDIAKMFKEVTAERDKKAGRFFNWLQKQDSNAFFGEEVNSNELVFVSHEWWKIWEKYPKLSDWFFHHMDIAYSTVGCCCTGFPDEYDTCHSCNKIIRTSPTCHGWSPDYITTEYERICRECIEDNEDNMEILIDEYSNNSDKAIPDWAIPLVKRNGFMCLDDEEEETCQIFVSGLHPYQNADPKKIIENLEKDGYLDKYDFLFAINSTGQFDIHFSLWIKEKEK
jgi:hypothetical protein